MQTQITFHWLVEWWIDTIISNFFKMKLECIEKLSVFHAFLIEEALNKTVSSRVNDVLI